MESLFAAHARLKARIHGFRLPIRSRAGLLAVGAVYFGAPLAFGWWSLQRTIEVRDRNLGPQRERLAAATRAAGGQWRGRAAGADGGAAAAQHQ